MDDHLGYEKSGLNGDDDEDRDYRNSYKPKRINLSLAAWALMFCRIVTSHLSQRP